MIEAVIYDMDGVLIDSEPLWREAEIKSFATVGVTLTEAMCNETTGLRVDEVVAYWSKSFLIDANQHVVLENAIVERVIELVREKGKPLPGVNQSLTYFREKGIPVALASSSATKIIEAVLQKLDIAGAFAVIHSAEHEAYGKPHPAVYLSTATQLMVAPERCVAIEDSRNGLRSAKAAGMKCIAVPDIDQRQDQQFAQADVLLTSLLEISDRVWQPLTTI